MRNMIALLFVVSLAGCAGAPGPAGGATDVAIRAAPDANFGQPVDVDVVAVYDAALAERLAVLSAAEWFERKPQMLVEWSRRGLEAWSFEVAPGTLLRGPQAVIYDAGAKDLFVYAQYFSPGEHRARLVPGRALAVELAAQGFKVSQQ